MSGQPDTSEAGPAERRLLALELRAERDGGASAYLWNPSEVGCHRNIRVRHDATRLGKPLRYFLEDFTTSKRIDRSRVLQLLAEAE